MRFIGKFKVEEAKFCRQAVAELKFHGNNIPLVVTVTQNPDTAPTLSVNDWPLAGVFVGDIDGVMELMREAQAIAEDWKHQNWQGEKWDYATA